MKSKSSLAYKFYIEKKKNMFFMLAAKDPAFGTYPEMAWSVNPKKLLNATLVALGSQLVAQLQTILETQEKLNIWRESRVEWRSAVIITAHS